MAYTSLADCVADLERQGDLRRIDEEVDPNLEMAEIQRRVYQAKGPALLFTRVKGSAFPCLVNLYGTQARTQYLFRNTLTGVKALFDLKRDPLAWTRKPWKHLKSPLSALNALPRSTSSAPVMECQTTLSKLPQIVSWPKDGGAYLTLPQVYSEHPEHPGLRHSNLGMYRIQISGGDFQPDLEAGCHYQIHRGIGVHHHAAISRGEKLRVTIFLGGPPAHALAAVMPLPEGMPEVFFAGILAGRRFRYIRKNGYLLSADADFCITGTIDPNRTLPEGPFGDHLGYYSLAHPFPVMQIDKVFHRRGAILPFTVVGRPPQEDSHLAELIHELAGPILPVVIPGVHAVHAVEASGVHPLLLALASERYVPYGERRPRELLTHAHAILGFGQLSLAKYLFIAAKEDKPDLDIRDIADFIGHILERVDLREDLHFQTRTTMDTLDYSGTGLNAGSKLVMAVAGTKKRELVRELPAELVQKLPPGFDDMLLAQPGIAVVTGPALRDSVQGKKDLARLSDAWEATGLAGDGSQGKLFGGLPLVVIVDDATFTAKNLDNLLWVTFTRSDPARDIHGLWASMEDKHWGCRGTLIIDARAKPHHAPTLEPDPAIVQRVDRLGAVGGSLRGLY
jgi:4-hydroxy-3-polyprenylbenzoate decarboxylase